MHHSDFHKVQQGAAAFTSAGLTGSPGASEADEQNAVTEIGKLVKVWAAWAMAGETIAVKAQRLIDLTTGLDAVDTALDALDSGSDAADLATTLGDAATALAAASTDAEKLAALGTVQRLLDDAANLVSVGALGPRCKTYLAAYTQLAAMGATLATLAGS